MTNLKINRICRIASGRMYRMKKFFITFVLAENAKVSYYLAYHAACDPTYPVTPSSSLVLFAIFASLRLCV